MHILEERIMRFGCHPTVNMFMGLFKWKIFTIGKSYDYTSFGQFDCLHQIYEDFFPTTLGKLKLLFSAISIMNVTVADICWCICLVWISYPLFFCIFQTVSVGRRRFSANFQLVFRLIKFLIFVTFASILITLIALPHMTVQDIIVCILAFMPTGWGLLLVGEDILPANLSRISSAIFSLFFHIMNYMLL